MIKQISNLKRMAAMAAIVVHKVTEQKVHFRAEKVHVVEMEFVDSRGKPHKGKFALEDLLAVLNTQKPGEVESVSTKADQFEIVR